MKAATASGSAAAIRQRPPTVCDVARTLHTAHQLHAPAIQCVLVSNTEMLMMRCCAPGPPVQLGWEQDVGCQCQMPQATVLRQC